MSLVSNKTTNVNIKTKAMPTGKRVLNSRGEAKDEMIPVITYTTKYVDDCPRKIYKELKREYTNTKT